jgi:protein NirF
MLSRWICVCLALLLLCSVAQAEKFYVVERERGNLAVIEDQKLTGEIEGLGSLNHATVKFYKGSAYVVSRDGYLSRIDVATDRLVKKVKVGESAIGFIFIKDHVAVANYDPGSVVILDPDLNIIKRIETGSRNVGIKTWKNKLVFSLMDEDAIWVVDADKDFEVVHKAEKVGKMPFDAMISENHYVNGFFHETFFGYLDLESFEYKTIPLEQKDGEVLFKIPHFGLWGLTEEEILLPAVRDRKLHFLDRTDFSYKGALELDGNPVFVVTSPDGKHAAVSFSGDYENHLAIVDPETHKVVSDIDAGRRVMHFRYSADGSKLYLSSFFDNKVKVFNTQNWELLTEIPVPTPSGVFLAPEETAAAKSCCEQTSK